MKRGPSIRLKVAMAAGALSSIIVILFATLSAARFYHEQLDIFDQDSTKKISERKLLEARHEVTELAEAYLVALPFVAAGAAAGAWWMAGRITRPLTELAKAAAHLDAGTLHERLPQSDDGDEISRLARILNEVFDRLEKSFAQANRFAADASHELRTPLAIMRGEIESAIQAAPSAAQATVLVGLLEETHRLSAIADKLLLLAKADAGKLMADSENISLSELVEEISADLAIVAGEKSIQLENTIAPAIGTRGDAALLRQMIWNLFENAMTYNAPGGWIRTELTADAHDAVLLIANAGDPIPEALQERLFERFFRVSQARDRRSGGAGLGLNLCREIAKAHGGDLRLSSSTEGGTVFIASLPSVSLSRRALGKEENESHHQPE